MSETIFDHEELDVYRTIQSSTSTAMLSRSCELAHQFQRSPQAGVLPDRILGAQLKRLPA